MPKIYIDHVPHEAPAGQNLLQTVLTLGFDLPYFCWHPALHSIGACRQCAVKQFKDEQDTKGRIVMACMTPASDGTRISINDAEARAFRASIIEWLMTSHPHDCPVCDEGGECHLQDMTVMSGHVYRRFRFRKRTFVNQDLGPFINHEMNRCITCYRCVRYYRDYAGGKDLGAFSLRNQVYFGRVEDGVLENEFSGNLVEVCPTGVFTDKTFKRHFTRKWDLQSSPSICHHCALGCNIAPGERYGILRRIRNRYHHEINGYFLCDRGRYGYEFVNAPTRIRRPLLRIQSESESRLISVEEALERLKSLIRESKRIVAVGSPRASVESNFAMQMLGARGTYSNGMTRLETDLVAGMAGTLGTSGVKIASLRDIETSDAVLVLGEDLTNTAPRMALAVRQASRRRIIAQASKLGIPEWNDAAVRALDTEAKGAVFIASICATKLDEIADHVVHAAPDDIARLGIAAARAIHESAPEVPDLNAAMQSAAADLAALLAKAEHPVVIAGVSQRSASIIDAASAIIDALIVAGKKPSIAFAPSECNSMASAFIDGMELDELSASAEHEAVDLLVVCENDLYRHLNRDEAERLVSSARHVVVLDHTETMTSARAELVLPSAPFSEASGTLINNEGRAQRFFSVFLPADDDSRESWRWIGSGLTVLDPERKRPWNTLDDIIRDIADTIPALSPIDQSAPDASFRVEGLKIPRETPGFSGRTAAHAHQSVHEPKPPEDIDSALAYSMEGYPGQPPPALTPYVWAPGWNSVQASLKYQDETGMPLIGRDAGVKLFTPHAAGAQRVNRIEVPAAFTPREGAMLTVWLYHIFGSEELSAHASGIIQQTSVPYCGLNADDAARMGIDEGTMIGFTLAHAHVVLPARIIDGLVSGVVGIPWGLVEPLGAESPAWIDIKVTARQEG